MAVETIPTRIMNVWMSWVKRQATCKYCNRLIEAASPCVVCRNWKNGRKYEIRFHPECWVNNGLDYLRQHPYITTRQGRKKLDLTSDQVGERRAILKRYAMLRQQKKRLKLIYPDNIIPVLKIDSKIEALALEIKNIGGIPKKWDIQDPYPDP